MLCMLLAYVFNCEIVDNERERDWPSLVWCDVLGNIQMVPDVFEVID
jgi:hypothetical protein